MTFKVTFRFCQWNIKVFRQTARATEATNLVILISY